MAAWTVSKASALSDRRSAYPEAVTQDLPIEIRFQSSTGDPPLGPRDEEARALAFPDEQFANEIQFEGRSWRFSHTELMRGPNDNEPTWKRLVYLEKPAPN
jgi:hypothetical protein